MGKGTEPTAMKAQTDRAIHIISFVILRRKLSPALPTSLLPFQKYEGDIPNASSRYDAYDFVFARLFTTSVRLETRLVIRAKIRTDP